MACKKYCGKLLLMFGLISFLWLVGLPVSAVQTTYGTAGNITESERNPEQGDTSKWLTIQAGEAGVRIVSKDGREIVAVDNYGGIYLEGDIYVQQKLLNTKMFHTANGFFYLMLVISLAFGFYNAIKLKKLNAEYVEKTQYYEASARNVTK